MSYLGHYKRISILFTSPKKAHMEPITQDVLIVQLFGPNTIELMKGNSWSPSGNQPQNSNGWIQSTHGSHEVWSKTDKRWAAYLLVEPMPCPILLKKRRATASHLLQRDKSNQDAIFKLFRHLQLIPALHSTGNNEFWYCSHSRLMHNSSKTTGSKEDKIGRAHVWTPVTG